MTLHLQQDERTIYDSDTDKWYRFNTKDEAQEYCNQVEQVMHVAEIAVAASPRISGSMFTVGLAADMAAYATTAAFNVVSSDPVRQRVKISVAGGNTGNGILIGSRSDVLSGHGYYIDNGEDITIDSTAEIWCCGYALATVSDAVTLIVSTLQEYAS